MFVFQSGLHNPGGVSRILPALLRLLFLQRSSVSSASSAHLLGLSHNAYGLQVRVPGQGERRANKQSIQPPEIVLLIYLLIYFSS